MAYGEKTGTAAPRRPHNLTLNARRRLSLSGVESVESFDEHEIVMQTTEGTLVLRGEELSVGQLSTETGEVSVEGLITQLHYEESAPRGSFWSRLFH